MLLFDAIAAAPTPAALVTILHQDGSTPRTAGARMLVFPGNAIQGTIGGGLVEAKAIALAATVLETGVAVTAAYDLAGANGQGMDMICGGRLEVLAEPLDIPARAAFAELTAHLAAGRRAAMRTQLVMVDTGRLDIQREILADPPADAPAWDFCTEGQIRRLTEVHTPPPSLYLFGAGHVSQATAEVAHVAGFRVVVVDDRPEFANAARFPVAARIVTPASYDGLFAAPGLAEEVLGTQSHLAILTRGHRHDATVLAQALRTAAGWIGMIGSRSKRDATYLRLRQEGFGDADFARVACPIGLAIGAQTPGEIAISIVAQLVQHRAALQAGKVCP
ncbi:XdhC family protein [Megalodesulfovibrio gigas]|uniref:Putative XshC-Cox1-family protein n=1 Tax=Megalodesulfovibrio gigas (strain ATCC 19364 / DSM 1382 / NCIMB 9332 / VKM B-1759) TaxID=1121448 RepID=T2G9J7_MEGG1|nr:XdhC/CoxI family protein [Megalodesulfovibrio gigas]AGW12801.1 putative XshC-Cox1-family protein [Megalodesulfovibrio gigas DSM 1382 = ATCC 19364]